MRSHSTISRLNIPATLRHRRGNPALTIYRGTAADVHGALVLAPGTARLNLGRQWEDDAFFAAGRLLVAKGARLEVTGSFDIFTGLRITVDPGGLLRLGSGYINYEVRISCFSSISIGDDVAIAEQVMIRDSDNHRIKRDPEAAPAESVAPIVIGNHVWIGSRVTILKGVTIGDGAVVAADSVVTRDVPPNTLAAGVPATVKRTGVEWE